METYPKNQFLHLCAAYFFAKKLKLIRRPIDILMKLQGNSSPQIELNSELLLMEIQNTLNKKFTNPAKDHLDLTKFIYEKTLYIQAREKIISQADLQIKICHEIQKESPTLFQIFNDSQKLALHRKNTNKFIKNTLNLLSDHHMEPLLLYARYHLALNHSMNENVQYTKLYSQKLQKYHQYFEKDGLVQENMFSQDLSFTIFSCNEATLGKVFYSSKQFTKLLGRDNDSILAFNIMKNAPPCFQESFVEYYKVVARQGENFLKDDRILRGFICDKDHYLIEIDYYIDIHPFVTSEFYVNFIQKIIKSSNKDFMFVLENGDIDCTTRRIAERLSLFPSNRTGSPGTNFNIKDISEDLVDINNAFNMIFFDENNEYKEKTEKISKLYSETGQGQDVVLRSTTLMNLKKKSQFHINDETFYSYNCKVKNIPLGKSVLKLFTFEEKQIDTKKTLHLDAAKSPISQYRKAEFPKETEDGSDGYQDIQNEFDQFPSENDENNFDEKNNGWIDFHALNSKITSGEPQQTNSLGTQRTMTTQRGVQDTCRNLLFETKPSQFFHQKPIPVQSTGGRNTKQLENYKVRNQSVATSKWSKFSQQKRIFSLYEISLKTKYYPKLYKLFFGLFCVSFIVLLVSQLILKIILDENVRDLQTKKNILRCAETRNYQQVTIESTTRILWDYYTGNLPLSAFGSFAPLVFYYPILLNSYLLQLGETNQNLLGNTSYLEDDIREKFFKKDVDVFETYFGEENQTYATLNNFQAINILVETGLQLSSLTLKGGK